MSLLDYPLLRPYLQSSVPFIFQGLLASIATGAFGIISLATAALAAMLVQRESEEPFHDLFLSALPVIGAFRYLNDAFDKTFDGVMKR